MIKVNECCTHLRIRTLDNWVGTTVDHQLDTCLRESVGKSQQTKDDEAKDDDQADAEIHGH